MSHSLLRLAAAVCAAFAIAPANALTDAEHFANAGLAQINAPAFHEQYLRAFPLRLPGSGVLVAVIDTGLDARHREFAGPGCASCRGFFGNPIARDGNGHGTHVAGVIAARPDGAGLVGVAYGATLMPIAALDVRGRGSDARVAGAIDLAVRQRADVLNMSLGAPTPMAATEAALRRAVAAGAVVAVAAGNDGQAHPYWPARYAPQPWANGQIIAVGAVDARNVIASFSNRAGDTAQFYLVAPGVETYSAYPGGYARMSGTSMATPHVAGAAALVKSWWPHLTPREVAGVLLSTARDLGAPGVDAVYGRGLLDLEAAMHPVGPLTVPTANGVNLALDGTALQTSTAFAAGVRRAAQRGDLVVAGFDTFRRDFAVDLGAAVREPLPIDVLGRFFGMAQPAAHYARDGTRIAMAYDATAPESAPRAMRFATRDERRFAFGVNGYGGDFFGLAGALADDTPELAAILARAGSPYLSLAPGHTHVGTALPLANGLQLRIGAVAAASGMRPDALNLVAIGRQHATLAELHARHGMTQWVVGVGQLTESDAMLGTATSGALALGGEQHTRYATLGVGHRLTERIVVGVEAVAGQSPAEINAARSLVAARGDTTSQAYTAFLAIENATHAGDRLTLRASQPLRARGTLRLDAPVGIDAAGTILRESRSIALAPDGREIDIDLVYRRPLSHTSAWMAGIGLRDDPEHDRTLATQRYAALGYSLVW
jgi:hypothetical protein